MAAGETVLDVPSKLAARVRLLEAGDTNKNDPNDACSVAVAALRSNAPHPVIAEDHAVVLKVWAKRHRDLARARNQAASWDGDPSPDIAEPGVVHAKLRLTDLDFAP